MELGKVSGSRGEFASGAYTKYWTPLHISDELAGLLTRAALISYAGVIRVTATGI